jgi:CHAT domain-containing protein
LVRKVGTGRPLKPVARVPAAADKAEDRPYAHPYYWSGFILLGDPG